MIREVWGSDQKYFFPTKNCHFVHLLLRKKIILQDNGATGGHAKSDFVQQGWFGGQTKSVFFLQRVASLFLYYLGKSDFA